MKFTRKLFLLPLFLLSPAVAAPVEPVEKLLPRFDQVAEQLFKESGVPGMSVGIVADGKVVYIKGFGVRTAGDPAAVDENTIFQLASCSKPMTSTALAALVGKQTIRWDDRIVDDLPEFALQDPWVTSHATYKDMLSHHSGLPEFSGDLLEDLGADRKEILHQLRYLPPAYDFRAGYAYSNYGYTTGGEAAARAAGQTYEDMMEQVLFQPLGMTSTTASYDEFVKAPNHASSHQIVDGKALPTVRMPQPQAPAGGISSSAKDMTKWLLLHLERGKVDGQPFIPEAALAETYRIHSLTGNNPASFSGSGYYGLGWVVSYDSKGQIRIGHSGAFAMGIRSAVNLVPQEGIGIVVLTNAYPTAMPEALSATFQNLWEGRPAGIEQARQVNQQVLAVLNGMLGTGYQPVKPARPAPAMPLSTYVGRYDNTYFGEAEVRQSGSSLTLKLGTQQFPMEHLDRDVFLVRPIPHTYENLGPFEVQFALDGGGKVTGFRQKGLPEAASPWFDRR